MPRDRVPRRRSNRAHPLARPTTARAEPGGARLFGLRLAYRSSVHFILPRRCCRLTNPASPRLCEPSIVDALLHCTYARLTDLLSPRSRSNFSCNICAVCSSRVVADIFAMLIPCGRNSESRANRLLHHSIDGHRYHRVSSSFAQEEILECRHRFGRAHTFTEQVIFLPYPSDQILRRRFQQFAR